MIAWALGALLLSAPQAIDNASAYRLLGDPRSAGHILDEALEKTPEAPELMLAKLQALAQARDKRGLLQLFSKLNPELRSDSQLLDSVAWGIVEWGAQSQSEHLRRMSLVCAGMTRREAGVLIVEKMLKDSSSHLRAIAAHFSAQLRDERLAKRLIERLEKEPSGYVRPEIIRALGQMRVRAALPALKRLMSSPTLTAEEGALVQISCEMIGDVNSKALYTSAAPALRTYGARTAALENKREDFEAVRALCSDQQPSVRSSALFSLYTLAETPEQIDLFKRTALANLEQSNVDVQLIAAKVLMPYEPAQSASKLLQLIGGERLEISRKAAGLLSSSGVLGADHLERAFSASKDPITRLNLASGMLLHKKGVEVAASAIEYILKRPHIKLRSIDIGGAGEVYTEALGAFDFQIEEADLVERLALLNSLAHVDYKKAEEVSHSLLRSRGWGSLMSLASTFLKHQPDLALELIASHLESEDLSLRVQAALLLTHLRGDPKAQQVLIDCFHDPKAPRSAKLGILEGMLQVNARGSLDFFVSLLNEPYEALQIAAAGCIISALDR